MAREDFDREDGRAIQHSVKCGGCGGETFEFERYCHRCGFDRWEGGEEVAE